MNVGRWGCSGGVGARSARAPPPVAASRVAMCHTPPTPAPAPRRRRPPPPAGPQLLVLVPTFELGTQVALLVYKLFGGNISSRRPGDEANIFQYLGPRGIKVGRDRGVGRRRGQHTPCAAVRQWRTAVSLRRVSCGSAPAPAARLPRRQVRGLLSDGDVAVAVGEPRWLAGARARSEPAARQRSSCPALARAAVEPQMPPGSPGCCC